MKSETITAEAILNSEIPTRDKYWFFCRKVFSKEQNQRIAISLAKSVLSIYENKYPNDDRPRKAIKAAEDYLAGTITREELLDFRRAAYDAAAYAAYAAADADADADAAADAYAAYAAARKTKKEQLAEILKKHLGE